MADAIKVLGQLAPSATTTETLYTAPNLAQTTVSSLVICNRNAGNQTFRVSVHVTGAGADNKQFLYYDKEVAAKYQTCLLYTSPSPRDRTRSRMPSSA